MLIVAIASRSSTVTPEVFGLEVAVLGLAGVALSDFTLLVRPRRESGRFPEGLVFVLQILRIVVLPGRTDVDGQGCAN